MRRLVACPKCKRQYDAGKLAVGRRFHCHCGAVLTVRRARGHDADVVCCSSCGAARQAGSLACDHCGGDFTLHERDLHTVCPQCLARVSDKARYCHHCGKSISAEMVAGGESEFDCPACGAGRRLVSRAWGEVSVLECSRCAGMWLSNPSFQQLTERATKDGMQIEPRERAARARDGQTDVPARSTGYRPCAVCRELMPRRNYGRQSGVVIDVCRHHGAWFDADELSRILQWICDGGLVRVNEEAAAAQEVERRRSEVRASIERDASDNLTATWVFGDLSRWFSDLR